MTGTAQIVEVDRRSASLGQVINSAQVAELPLNGRNFVQLGTLGAGAVKGEGAFFNNKGTTEVSIRGSTSISVQGMRENANDFLLDGVDNNELTAGAVAILPSVESIQEFKVLTNSYSAEYGSRGGDSWMFAGLNITSSSRFCCVSRRIPLAVGLAEPLQGDFDRVPADRQQGELEAPLPIGSCLARDAGVLFGRDHDGAREHATRSVGDDAEERASARLSGRHTAENNEEHPQRETATGDVHVRPSLRLLDRTRLGPRPKCVL